jgi:thymidylate synthase (FAD)
MDKIDVLDHGFVRLVDSMGGDLSVVRAARVSYDAEWRAGDDTEGDRKLINYLWKNKHSTPFEAVTLTFEVKAPIFVYRQWHRHRTWCLSGDTKLKFARPCDGKPYWKTLKEIYDQWNVPITPVKRPDKQKRTLREFNRERIHNMELYCIENSANITTTKIVDCWQSGIKQVFEITTDCGNTIKASKDHKFLTEDGWKTLSKLTIGKDRILTINSLAPNTTISCPSLSDKELRTEQWLPCSDVTVLVSNLGRVMRHGNIIEPTINAVGRSVISIKINDKWQTVQVSRLVAKSFLPTNNETTLQVLHNDDCPQNNRSSNLKWGTAQDNSDDAFTNSRRGFNGIDSMGILSIEFIGKEMTFDIEVDNIDHNFIANNFCTHNSYNELSARYRELPEEFYIPEIDQITTQSADNKQMRTDIIHPKSDEMRIRMQAQNHIAFMLYKKLLTDGCPRELARSVLPLSTYSHMFATVNLLNFLKFLSLRDHNHAQYEIQVYAQAMKELAKSVAPVCLAAWEKTHAY